MPQMFKKNYILKILYFILYIIFYILLNKSILYFILHITFVFYILYFTFKKNHGKIYPLCKSREHSIERVSNNISFFGKRKVARFKLTETEIQWFIAIFADNLQASCTPRGVSHILVPRDVEISVEGASQRRKDSTRRARSKDSTYSRNRQLASIG